MQAYITELIAGLLSIAALFVGIRKINRRGDGEKNVFPPQ